MNVLIRDNNMIKTVITDYEQYLMNEVLWGQLRWYQYPKCFENYVNIHIAYQNAQK